MSERPPLDPWGGSVNYFPVPKQCPRSIAEGIVVSTAVYLGIGVRLLPNQTKEDRGVIDRILGIDKDEDPVKDSDHNQDGGVKTVVSAPIPPASVVFLARMPVEAGEEATPNYELAAEKLDQLHITAAALALRVN
jgi:hypothetical protein